MKNKSNIIIAILIVTATVLGYLIFIQSGDQLFFGKNETETQELGSEKLGQSKQGKADSQVFTRRRPTPVGLSEDEAYLLSPPGPTSPQEHKSKHYQLVEKMAAESDILNLNKCEKPVPLVLKVKKGGEFKVRNDDKVEHTIRIDEQHKYPIPSGSTKSIKADFGRGNGAYGYLCDDLGGVVGYFYVTP